MEVWEPRLQWWQLIWHQLVWWSHTIVHFDKSFRWLWPLWTMLPSMTLMYESVKNKRGLFHCFLLTASLSDAENWVWIPRGRKVLKNTTGEWMQGVLMAWSSVCTLGSLQQPKHVEEVKVIKFGKLFQNHEFKLYPIFLNFRFKLQ